MNHPAAKLPVRKPGDLNSDFGEEFASHRYPLYSGCFFPHRREHCHLRFCALVGDHGPRLPHNPECSAGHPDGSCHRMTYQTPPDQICAGGTYRVRGQIYSGYPRTVDFRRFRLWHHYRNENDGDAERKTEEVRLMVELPAIERLKNAMRLMVVS